MFSQGVTMPRKPRIEIAGYYHIVNRGVDKMTVFRHREDYEYFEELMCSLAGSHNITLHNYCLMSNHYHLLIEITQPNLSKFMRQLNMNYAIYFNKKYKRSGHLWQGRFKSWYVTDEAYLYTLMCYIEQNPLKAGMVERLEEYPYSSYNYFLQAQIPACLSESWIIQHNQEDKEAIRELLNSKIDTAQLQELKTASSLVEAPDIDIKPDREKLKKMFDESDDIKTRNAKIVQAYEQDYSQHMIAKVLGISQPAVHGVIRRSRR